MSPRHGARTSDHQQRTLVVVFVITIFLSASLLFLVQPMVAKMALPLLGGTPAVWNTAMMFFQCMLLLGYLYAHVATRWLGIQRHAWIHIGIMLPAVLVLPIAIRDGWVPPAATNPVGWLLIVLLMAAGLPFFIVSASAPLLQRWFSTTRHPAASDPYFLYAASNAGSMIALISYPLLLEMWMDLPAQSELWSFGYVALIVLMVVCVIGMQGRSSIDRGKQRAKRAEKRTVEASDVQPLAIRAIAPARLFRWILLAFVPSSLMLGVTTYITTDLVVVPLLWVIPLALYLLTFILVFARRQVVSPVLMRRAMPIVVVVLVMILVSEATEPLPVIAAAHLAAFFILAMVCHGELARDRPPAAQLTTFYLMMSIGGLLGGVFNAIIAPQTFTTIAEYPIAIVAACLLAPAVVAGGGGAELVRERLSIRMDALPALIVGLCTAAFLIIANTLQLAPGPVRLAMLAGLPAMVCFLLSMRSLRFGLAIGAVLLVASFDTAHRGHVLEADRTFFGVHRVTYVETQIEDEPGVAAFHMLYHGTTLHGQQFVDTNTRQPIRADEPLAYYHRVSPLGQLLNLFQQAERASNVGLIGLGVGAIAAYADDGDSYTYFEIDPSVVRIAEDVRFFSYLRDARQRGATVDMVLGDARLTLAREDEARFDMLIADAFSSDSIPVHLLTGEAFELYFSRVHDSGIIAVHISNRYLNLEPVLANIAADLGVVCYVQHDAFLDEAAMLATGKQNSSWVVLARDADDLKPLLSTPIGARWGMAEGDPSLRTWTDRYTNILRVMMW